MRLPGSGRNQERRRGESRHLRPRRAKLVISVGAAILTMAALVAFDGVVSERSSAAPSASTTTSPTTTVPTTATTAPTTTTTSLPDGMLWKADYESGNDWTWDGIAISGNAESSVVTSPTHRGSYSNALTIRNADGNGTSPGVRMVFKNARNSSESNDENLPNEAYYSAWYYIPHNLTVTWLNIHQWKQQHEGSARHLYSASLFNDDRGDLVFRLSSSVDGNQWRQNFNKFHGNPSGPVPIGRWFHLESYYKWGENGTGRIITWLDGQKIWDVSGLTTGFDWPHHSYSRQWAVNNYAADTTPSTFTIYVDDAIASTKRIGLG